MSLPTVRMDPEYIDSVLHWLTQGEKPDRDAAEIIMALKTERDGAEMANCILRAEITRLRGYLEKVESESIDQWAKKLARRALGDEEEA